MLLVWLQNKTFDSKKDRKSYNFCTSDSRLGSYPFGIHN